MMDRPKKNVAVLGAGYIADFHLKALAAVPNANVVAICDLNLALAQRLANTYGVPQAFGSIDEMLERQPLDVVHLLLPPEAHFQTGKKLLEAGVGVLFEKPLATSEADCRALLALAEAQGRKIGTSHNFLFSSVYEQLRSAVKSGKLGQIDQIDIVWNKFLPQARFGPYSAWMLRNPRNIMLEIGPHSFAHLLDLLPGIDSLEVDVARALDLPSGGKFYQRWDVRAASGPARALLRFSLIEGYTEHQIRVRGTVASASVDFERDTFQMHCHRPLAPDFDRFAAIASESALAVRQGVGTLTRYALTKAKLSDAGAPFQASITRSVKAYYEGLERGSLDERQDGDFSARVVSLGERVGSLVPVEAAAPKAATAPVPAPSERADVLVTGATGFIGRELVRQLIDRGMSVRIVSRGRSLPAQLQGLPVEVRSGALSDPKFVEDAVRGVRHVVHLARSHGTSWAEFERDDVRVTEGLARAAMAAGVERFVYASSIVIYYLGASAGPITEDTPADPAVVASQAYAKAKVVTEQLLLDMHRNEKLPLVIVRPGIVLGAGGPPRHWGIGMWPHHSVVLTWGKGQTELPVVLVRDVADGIVRCLTTPRIEGESFNFVGDARISATEYLDAFEAAAGVRLERSVGSPVKLFASDLAKWVVKVVARYPDPTRPSLRAAESRSAAAPFDCSRAKRILGWQPVSDRAVLIEEGVRQPVAEFVL